ncbi:hypothetical protein Y032_0021g368 [Ancylostoma ceylanicum]|uniref:Secreted protein n=1 Tax=Ancylostoma ceylanicum TaxID=53326 RepID=A0A016V102_9BILA|nr:hypothetical protein Y032_0021g368 [Ancylostoma ceylanicum]
MNCFVALTLLFITVTSLLFKSRCTFFSISWNVTLQFDKIEPLCHRLLLHFNHESNMAQQPRDMNGVHGETFTTEY